MVNDVDAYRAANNLDGVGSIPSRLSDLYSFTNAVIYRKYDVLDKILEVKVIIYKDHYDLNQVFLERDVFVPEFNFKGIITRIQELAGDKYEITIKEPGWHFTRRLYKIGGATEWDVAVTTSDSYTAHLQEILDSANLDMPFTWTLNDGIPTGVELNFKLNHKSHYEYLSISAMNAGYNLWFDGPRVSVGVKGKDIKIDRKDVIFKKLETDQDLDVYANILKFIGGKDSGGTKLSKTETVVNDLKYDYETAVVNTEIETSGVLDSLAPKVLANTSNLDPDVEMSVTREIYDKYAFESGDRVELLSKDANQKTEGIFRIIEINVSVDNANPDKIDIKLMKNKENVFAPAFKSLTDALDIIYDKISDIELGGLDNVIAGAPITEEFVENGPPVLDNGYQTAYEEQTEKMMFGGIYAAPELPITETEANVGLDKFIWKGYFPSGIEMYRIGNGSTIRAGIKYYNSNHELRWFSKAKWNLKRVGNPSGNIVMVHRNSGDTIIETSAPISVSSISNSVYEETEFVMAHGNKFNFNDFVQLEYSGGDGSNYISLEQSAFGYSGFRATSYIVSNVFGVTFAPAVQMDTEQGIPRNGVPWTLTHVVTADDMPTGIPGISYINHGLCLLARWKNTDSITTVIDYAIFIDNGNGPNFQYIVKGNSLTPGSLRGDLTGVFMDNWDDNGEGNSYSSADFPLSGVTEKLNVGSVVHVMAWRSNVQVTAPAMLWDYALWVVPTFIISTEVNLMPFMNTDGNYLCPKVPAGAFHGDPWITLNPTSDQVFFGADNHDYKNVAWGPYNNPLTPQGTRLGWEGARSSTFGFEHDRPGFPGLGAYYLSKV